MPINTSAWDPGWGTFNPFRSRGVPTNIREKYDPRWQSPYATDPTSSSARAAAGLNPLRFGTPEENATWDSIQEYYKNPMSWLTKQFGTSNFNPLSGSGTQPDPHAGMTQLWRDPSGMIHDFGDNPQPTTQPNGSMDMSQMMNIFEMLNTMMKPRGNGQIANRSDLYKKKKNKPRYDYNSAAPYGTPTSVPTTPTTTPTTPTTPMTPTTPPSNVGIDPTTGFLPGYSQQ